MRHLLGKLAAAAAVATGLVLVVFAQGCSLLLGSFMKNTYQEYAPPLVVDPQVPPSAELYSTLLEMRGTLQSGDELQLPEYGIRLPAICILAEARVVARSEESEGHPVLHPLSEEKQAELACPSRQLWADTLQCGAYKLHPDFIPSLLKTRSTAGHICERSILPLPAEHIHLPEHLQSMARLLPETQRLDRPDCTILRLAERYRDATVPTGEAEPGDIELRFSYLPAEIPVVLRARMAESYLCKEGTSCALATGDKNLPSVEGRALALATTAAICLLPLLLCIVLTLGGFAALKLGFCCLLSRPFLFPMPRMVAATFSLQALAILFGWMLS